jgi:glycosyltransferase involved in cell wall biosynthesis
VAAGRPRPEFNLVEIGGKIRGDALSAGEKSPQVSVLMSVYNGERFLRAAIQSILDQTFGDFEFIAVDDGSTDASPRILDEFAARDPRVKPIKLPHVGFTRALNTGLAAARGELLARMDGDDEALPQRFEIQVRYLREHPDVVLVGAQVMQIDQDGDPLAPLPGLEAEHEKIDQALMQLGWPLVHPTVIMRTDDLRAVGGYPHKYPHEDHDLFLRLAERGRLANVPQTLLRYRRHPANATANVQFHHHEVMVESVQIACQRRGIAVTSPPKRYADEDGNPRRARARSLANWGWASLKAGNIATARKYARRAALAAPAQIENWKLLVCALRGH